MVFQHFNLFPHLTRAAERHGCPDLRVRGEQGQREPARRCRCSTPVGLAEHADKLPHRLSGGQQQRVAIARALATKPQLMLFDEPTSALDPELVGEVLVVMRQLAADGMTMIVVTHELRFARDVADRAIFLEGGRIVEDAPARELLTAPEGAADPAVPRLSRRHAGLTQEHPCSSPRSSTWGTRSTTGCRATPPRSPRSTPSTALPRPARMSDGRMGLENKMMLLSEHTGTHLDAPSHFHEGGRSVDQIPLENLVLPGHLLDLTHKRPHDAIEPADLDRRRGAQWLGRSGRAKRSSSVPDRTSTGAPRTSSPSGPTSPPRPPSGWSTRAPRCSAPT